MAAMKCLVCKHGETEPGTTTITLERGTVTLVMKGVPAQVCDDCGEAYVDEQTTKGLLETAEAHARAGVRVKVCHFRAASGASRQGGKEEWTA